EIASIVVPHFPVFKAVYFSRPAQYDIHHTAVCLPTFLVRSKELVGLLDTSKVAPHEILCPFGITRNVKYGSVELSLVATGIFQSLDLLARAHISQRINQVFEACILWIIIIDAKSNAFHQSCVTLHEI